MVDMNNSFNDRRKYLRVYRNFVMSYYEKNKTNPNHHVSQVNNVSKGGVSFSSEYPLKQGVLLMIDLKTPFIADSIHLEGTVLQSIEKVSDMIYEIRVEFKTPAAQVLAVLEKIEKYSKIDGD